MKDIQKLESVVRDAAICSIVCGWAMASAACERELTQVDAHIVRNDVSTQHSRGLSANPESSGRRSASRRKQIFARRKL